MTEHKLVPNPYAATQVVSSWCEIKLTAKRDATAAETFCKHVGQPMENMCLVAVESDSVDSSSSASFSSSSSSSSSATSSDSSSSSSSSARRRRRREEEEEEDVLERDMVKSSAVTPNPNRESEEDMLFFFLLLLFFFGSSLRFVFFSFLVLIKQHASVEFEKANFHEFCICI